MKNRKNAICGHGNPRHRGQALIGLVVVAALVMIYYAFTLGHHTDSNGVDHKSPYAEALDRGQEVALDSNLNQIRTSIGMYKSDNDGHVPASLDELKHYCKFPQEMWVNPVDQKPLIYDPTTGSIYADGQTPVSGFRHDFGRRRGNDTPAPPAQDASGASADGSGSPSGAAATPAPPVAPGVPDPSSVVSKIPQPAGGADSSMQQ